MGFAVLNLCGNCTSCSSEIVKLWFPLTDGLKILVIYNNIFAFEISVPGTFINNAFEKSIPVTFINNGQMCLS